MRRVIILHALFWLDANNILHKDVIINYEKIANWENKFVPRSIKDNIVFSPSDYSKHKSYTYNLSENNLKNDVHAAILDCNKLQSGLFSRCVFSNIDGTYYHLVLKLISAMNNLANNDCKKTKPVIVYSANGHPTYLND